MTRRRLLAAGVVLAVLQALPASASASAATPTPPGGPLAEAREAATAALAGAQGTAAVSGRTADHASPTQALRAVRDHRDTGAWIDAIAGVVAQRHGGSVATSTSDTVECCEEEEPYTGSFGAAASAGDIDGDARDDVLAYSHDLETGRVLLEGRSGLDASPRWERTMPGDNAFAWSLGADITGDGATDVFEMSLDILEESHDAACDDEEGICHDETYSATFRWGLTLLSGADGSQVWTRSYDGELTERWSMRWEETAPVMDTSEYTYALEGTAVDVLPLFADLAGDSSHEFVVNVIDVDLQDTGSDRWVYAGVAGAGVYDGSFTIDAVTQVELMDAGSGVTLDTFTEDSNAMLAVMYPLQQADGDSLVWERASIPDQEHRCAGAGGTVVWHGECLPLGAKASTSITVLDPHLDDALWTAEFDGLGYSYPVGGDLDADGLNDLVVYTDDESFQASFVTAASGETLWADGVDFIAVGPLDAAPGDDLVTVAFSYTETPPASPFDEEYAYEETMTLERRNGVTGEVLLSESRTGSTAISEDEFVFTFPYAAGGADADGDGAPDITVGLITVSEKETEDDWVLTVAGRDSVAQSGASGATLYEAPDGPLIFPVADFDADGLTEIAQIAYTNHGEDETATFTPLRLTDAMPLWTATGTGAFVTFAEGGDFNGDGGTDVLRHIDVLEGRRVQTMISNLAGRSGQSQWVFGSRP